MKKMALCLALFLGCSTAYAGVIIGGTRVIFEGGKKETSLSVNNPDSSPYLIQSWVENTDNGKPPFVITPPLFRLDAQQQNIMRILNDGSNLAADRESLYWVNIKSIPSKAADKENVLQVAIKTRIKLIYRPQALKDKRPEDMAEQLRWTRSAGQLQVKNPTPYYMNFYEINVGGQRVKDPQWVAPFATKTYSLNGAVSGNVTWKLISDFGASGRAHQAQL
ncbi:molecular chaperone [Enterobacteriaceae bacterium BIT-l23]|uniref:Molecular chaperone n=1 Tax=Jejubacter calystegiae TaxID=2579935 RepID=A0A4P8YD35_9ENTR|nr:molecular chaperone [Jejubacter calystegiae]NUU66738.1 molecular chaperone [Enterobacteriaceae bacterium BIT-l23]QCT18389.1 molecular chaperone [Jejubacter calystegiae]